MQCFKRCALVFLLACAGAAAAAVAGAVMMPDWLTRSDEPAAASAIVVLGGDPTRALEAAELYRAGFARRVFITAPIRARWEQRLDKLGVITPREEDLTRAVLTGSGVPDAAIELLGRDLASTAGEAGRIARKLGAGSEIVLVVTSPYHVARSRMIIAAELPRERLRVIGSRFEAFPERWWRDQDASRNVVLEIAKIAFFAAGGRF